MPLRLLAVLIAVAAAAVAAGGCGGDDTQPAAATVAQPALTTTAPAAAEQQADAVAPRAVLMLDTWTEQLIPALVLLRDSTRANQSGNVDRGYRLWKRFRTAALPIQRWGRDARKEFIDDAPTKLTKATVAAGDAWSRWALTLRTDPPAGDFAKAQDVADLGADAFAKTRRVYRLAGEPIPAAFRRR